MRRLHRYLQETVGLGLGGEVESHAAVRLLRLKMGDGSWWRLVLAPEPEAPLPLDS